MTVDIKRLTAHLPLRQQDEIARAYKTQEEHGTTAFLWCFFLGWMGAHRFYLHQWGQAFIHLIIALLAIGIIVVGVLTNLNPTIIVLGALPFGLIALVWEIIDLYRIDNEVSAHNLKAAETLIAATMLSDTTALSQVQTKLDEVVQDVAAQSAESAQPEQGTADLAGAESTVERYEATTTTHVSDDPNAKEKDEKPVAPGTRDWNETEVASVDEPPNVDGIQTPETVTLAHTEAGYSTTDSVDTIINETAAATNQSEDTVIAADMTPITTAEAEAPTWPNLPAIEESEDSADVAAVTPDSLPVAEMNSVPASRPIDFTDMGGGSFPVTAVADVDTPGAVPLIVSLGDEITPVDVVTPVDVPSAMAAESYIPPVVPVVELSTAQVEPDAEESASSPPETLAELAGLAPGMVGIVDLAGAPAASPVPEVAHAEEIEQTSHMLKRIRVTRQIKVNGQVVEETSAEELIEADADPDPVRQRLHEQLHTQAAIRMAELGISEDQSNA